jgi:hypothetical protein
MTYCHTAALRCNASVELGVILTRFDARNAFTNKELENSFWLHSELAYK